MVSRCLITAHVEQVLIICFNFVSMSVNKPFSAILPICLRVYGKLTFVLSWSFLFYLLFSVLLKSFWGSLNIYLTAWFSFFLFVAHCRIIIESDFFSISAVEFSCGAHCAIFALQTNDYYFYMESVFQLLQVLWSSCLVLLLHFFTISLTDLFAVY